MKRNLAGFVLVVSCLVVVSFSTFGQADFLEVTNSGLPTGGTFDAASADFDGDGLFDVMMTGTTDVDYTATLYRNNGANTFAAVGQPIATISPYRNVFWADENGDGLLDFLMTRTNLSGAPSPRIFLQNADHTFTEMGFGLEGEAVGWCDLDNDGSLDVLVHVPSPLSTAVYWKSATGVYTRGNLVAGRFVMAADVDADGDLDVVTFATTQFNVAALRKIFRNDGFRHFTDTSVTGMFSFAADFNDDGLLDFAGNRAVATFPIIGSNIETDVYLNGGAFAFQTNAVPGLLIDNVMSAADYTGDGLADLFCFAGPNYSGVAPVLMVNTNGGFVRSDATFSTSSDDVNEIEAADFDGDGDLDFITSPRGQLAPSRVLIRNQMNSTRFVAAPTNLTSVVQRDRVDFSWSGADRRATSFNLRVGTMSGANDVMSSESLADGRRLVARMGNAGATRKWHLSGLKPGTYYWSVQAVDWGFRGSGFGPELSFTIGEPGPLLELPAIIGLQNIAMDEDTTVDLPFSISPADAAAQVEIFAESSNTAVVPNFGLQILGAGGQRTLRIKPGLNRSGIATVTVNLQDAFGQRRSTTFVVQVLPVNDPPVISEIPDQFVYMGGADLLIHFNVSDAETPPGQTSPFKVTATSSDTNVVPNANLTAAATSFQIPLPTDGFDFTLRIKIPTNRFGSTTITLTTSDGQANASRSFVLVVARPAFSDMGVRFGAQTAGGLGPLVTADFNNDGQMDVLVGNGAGLILFKKTTEGYLQQLFPFITGAAVLAQDFNNDNWVDVLVIAQDRAMLYLNNKGTNFTGTRITGITPLYSGRVEVADLDNDGDLDLFVVGFPSIDSTSLVTLEYLNDGATWRSIPVTARATSTSNFTLTDFDGDGFVDFVGEGRLGGLILSGVWRGSGGGRFEYQAGSESFVPPSLRAMADFDSDGVLEFLNTEQGPIVRGEGTPWSVEIFNHTDMAPQLVAKLDGPTNTSLSRVWGDFDNDGLIDLLFTPTTSTSVSSTRFQLWQNLGGFEFTSLGNPFSMLTNGPVAVADMNGDGSLDLIGQPTNRIGLMIVTNTTTRVRAVPGDPRNLRAERFGEALRFSWDSPGDSRWDAALTYNVRIGSTPGGADVVSPMSLANGRRLVMAPGNAGNRLNLTLTNLTKERYYWSVQAVDNRSVAGVFAPEQEVGFDLPGKTPVTVHFSPAEYIGGEDLPGLMTLTIVDDNTPISEVRLRVYTETTAFLSFSNLTLTGTGAVRGLKITPPPNRSGQARLIVVALDASGPVSTNTTMLTITNVNDAPTISLIPDQFSNGPGDPVTAYFIVSDVDDAVDTLTLSAESGNEDILPSNSVVFGGAGANRTITLQTTSSTPGIFPVAVKVTDLGGAFRQTTFQMAFTNRVFRFLNDGFIGVGSGAMVWGDVDNDGDLDVVISGPGAPISQIYLNQGGGVFTDGPALPGNSLGGVDWGDIDNDGNLDLIVQGFDGEHFVTDVYRGDGHGNFSPMNLGLRGLSGVPQFGDFDNDGSIDFLVTGTSNIVPTSALYLNRKGTFAPALTDVVGEFYGWRGMFEDFNMDGRLDIRMRGLSNTIAIDKLFLQTPSGGLEPQTAPSWSGWLVAWADFDNDGWPDALVATAPPGSVGSLLLQKNLGGSLAPPTLVVPNVLVGPAMVGDYDSDGFIDFVLSGNLYVQGSSPRLFQNDGKGGFLEAMTPLPFLGYSGASWADVDGDGDLDLMVSGLADSGADIFVTQLFRNDLVKPLATLIAPQGLRARQMVDGVWIEWDANAGRPGLTYNVAVGTAPGKWDVLSPLSGTNGRRKVVAKGNAGWKTSKLLHGLEIGKTYYYTVQAVDNAFRGSPFAAEQSVLIEGLPQLQISAETPGFSATLIGTPQREYVIEISSDLEHWSELGTFKDPAGVIQTGPVATPAPGATFVRARGK
jgi:hypothetical protein